MKRCVIMSVLLLLSAELFGDLNVTLIERLPRYDYDAAKNNPEPGDGVIFKGHIVNWSDTEQTPDYCWKIDGVTVQQQTSTIPAMGESIVELQWSWQSWGHTVELVVDPNNNIGESSETNNSIKDYTNAIIAGFWVEQSVYDYFHEHQHELGIGSNSWPDWIQRQMAKQNELSEQAVWPTSPDGVIDRVRIDKIVVVPDGALPLNGGLASNHPDLNDKTVDLMWGFPASLLNGSFYANHTSVDDNNPFFIEKSLIHELGHARYLIDSYGFDVHNTGQHHSVQVYEGDTYVAGSEYLPFIAWGEVLYYNKSGGVMSGSYGFQWSPYEAAALNLIAGQRARCGNYNAPCNIGVYLQDLPANNHLRLVDTEGQPWVGADVRIYQTTSGYGWYGKTIDNIFDQQYTTDPNGYIHMPQNPFNPGGDIIHTYGNANGVMLIRVGFGGQVWYRFMEVSDFNMQYWQGNIEDGYYTIELDGQNYIDTEPPTVPGKPVAESVSSNEVVLSWAKSSDNIGVVGYNVYRDDVKIDSSDANSYTDSGASACSSYSYSVTAYDAFNESPRSEACAVSLPPAVQSADINNDRQIDLVDLVLLCENWLSCDCGISGDFNADRIVDIQDFSLFSSDFMSDRFGQDSWPMRQRDMYHTGRASYTVPESRLNGTFFDTILWQQRSPGSPSAGNFTSSSMVFYDGVGPDGDDVVVCGYHWPKGVQAMDRHDGRVLWYGNPDGGESIGDFTPAFSPDGTTVYVANDATAGHPLMAFETITGPSSYRHNGGDVNPDLLSMCSPTISADGRIWLHGWDDRPYGATDFVDVLSKTWGASSSVSACYSNPSLYSEQDSLRVVSSGRSAYIKAWDGQSGDEIWSVWAGHNCPADATVTIDPENGNIYAAAGFDDVYVVGLDKNGQPLWTETAMAVHDYQPGVNNPHRAQSTGCLSFDGNTYYFQTNSNGGDGKLFAINTVDGTVKWSYPTESRGWEMHSSSPIVTLNGVVIVGNNDGGRYFALLDNGTSPLLLDTLDTDENGNARSSATISKDGTLYLPIRTTWTTGNGDGENPTNTIQNVFTAFSLN